MHERPVQFVIRVDLDRDDLALLEFFPQPGLRIGEPDVLLESAHQVFPVLLAWGGSAPIYQAGVEEFEEGGETALVAVVRRGAQQEEAIRTPGQYFSELAALAALSFIRVSAAAGSIVVCLIYHNHSVRQGALQEIHEFLLLEEVHRGQR